MNRKQQTLQLWEAQLITMYHSIQDELNRLHQIRLSLPNFEISPDLESVCGMWNPQKRLIRLAEKLFSTQPFYVIEETLKHEIAHQIVSEVYKVDRISDPHGEAFRKACRLLEIEPDATLKADQWLNDADGVDPVVDKIRKVMTKAHCESVSEAEAEVFLKKAQAMMLKYNVSQCAVDLDERTFLRCPVGKLHKKMPSYLFDFCRLLEKHYFVRYIQTYAHVPEKTDGTNGERYITMRYIELFGEPSNVEISSYLFDVLSRQTEFLWEGFKKELKKQGIPVRGRYTKGSYIRGVIAGYDSKLDAQKEQLALQEPHYGELIRLNDPLLEEMYRREYTNLRVRKTQTRNDAGYGLGFKEGQNLTLNQPLSSSKNNRRFLT